MSAKELSVAINSELVRIGLCDFIFPDDIETGNAYRYYIELYEYLKKEK